MAEFSRCAAASANHPDIAEMRAYPARVPVSGQAMAPDALVLSGRAW